MKTINKKNLKIILMSKNSILIELEGINVFVHRNIFNYIMRTDEDIPYRIESSEINYEKTNWLEVHMWRRM